MNRSVWWRLSIMMFLQYVIWGAWAPVLSAYLEKQLGFTPMQSAWVYSLFPLMCIISPFAGGQLADRYFPTQWVLGVLHIIGGVCLMLMGQYTSFQYIMLFMLVYSLAYTPTLALTNSICFHHMENSERDFGKIRVWGTIGWILIGWSLSLMRNYLPAIKGDCLIVSGIAAVGMGVFCFFLPHTPPRKESESPWAFLKAFALFKDKSFVIFMAISFIVVTELQFYYLLTAPFLQDIGVKAANVPAWMTLAQLAEILTMAWALPVLLPKTGVRWALAIGVIAWPIRYIIFAIGAPVWLVIASLTLHGVCYVFFFTVGVVYVNSVAPQDIRASAQSLLAVITLGIGSFIGMHFAGFIKAFFSGQEPLNCVFAFLSGRMFWFPTERPVETFRDVFQYVVINYTAVFLVPCALTIACAAAFLIWFRPEKAHAVAQN